MRAARVVRLDGPAAIEVGEVPEPDADGKVLIDVHAAGVSFPELLQTRGAYQVKPELPFILGSEVAGVVRAAPPASGFAPGDRVAGMSMVGGFAEVVAVDPALLFPLPDSVSFASGTAVPMNYLTMHFALIRRGALLAGETVLVHGAAGGIGTASIQLAKALGARVIAVTSTPEKGEVARGCGADVVVPADGFLAAVKEVTGGAGADVVVDPVGGDRFTDSLRCLAPEGRLLVIGFTGGEIPTVKVNRLLLNNIAVVGVGWGAFALRNIAYLRQEWDELFLMLADGRIEPLVGVRFPLDEAAAALGALETRTAVGKTVLTVR